MIEFRQKGLGFDLFSAPPTTDQAEEKTTIETVVPYLLALAAVGLFGVTFWPRKRRR